MANHNRVQISEPPPEGAVQTPPVDPAATPPAGAERPAGLPEKFKSVEDMVTSYTALEEKLGAGKADPPADPPPAGSGDPGEGDPVIPPAPAEGDPADTGEPSFLVKFEEEFAKGEGLSDASYEELATKHGLTRAHVDDYIAGREAKIEGEKEAVFSEVGGVDTWNEMMAWAAKGIPEARKEQLNAMLATGGEQAKIAAQTIKADFAQKNGLDPNYVSADGLAVEGAGGVFESSAQVRAAMSDKRYKEDPAYQKMVASKLARSNITQ